MTTVLVTGAAGYVAGQLLPAFRKRYNLRLVDVRDTDRDGARVEGVEVADLLADDRDRLAPFFDGTDVVVHCGHVAPVPADFAAPDAADRVYAVQRRNVDMTQRVYQLALDHGVRRVVAASTNQAAKWYEQPYHAGLVDRVTPGDYPKPDTFYGWAKTAYETLGFLYACGGVGRALEVVLLRIVAPRDADPDLPPDRYVRDLTGYISERDLQQLFRKSIETEDVSDEHGVPFQIFYGVSNNARTFWSITNARRTIGYAPEDDSERRFAADIARVLGDGD